MNFCKDCRYIDNSKHVNDHNRCLHNKCYIVNPVSGEKEEMFCKVARMNDAPCGPTAILFKKEGA